MGDFTPISFRAFIHENYPSRSVRVVDEFLSRDNNGLQMFLNDIETQQALATQEAFNSKHISNGRIGNLFYAGALQI